MWICVIQHWIEDLISTSFNLIYLRGNKGGIFSGHRVADWNSNKSGSGRMQLCPETNSHTWSISETPTRSKWPLPFPISTVPGGRSRWCVVLIIIQALLPWCLQSFFLPHHPGSSVGSGIMSFGASYHRVQPNVCEWIIREFEGDTLQFMCYVSFHWYQANHFQKTKGL
jgi:hypothetical protein